MTAGEPDTTAGRPRSAFALEGRPAPGLYLVAWLVSGIGFALLLVAGLTRPPVQGILLVGSIALVGLGLASAAGYQVVRRAGRPREAFRGASPLLLFGIQIAFTSVFGLVLLVFGLQDPRSGSVAFLLASVGLLLGYAVVVWIFGVRSDALTWAEILRRPFARPAGLLGDLAFGAATMALAWPLVTMLAGLLAMLLRTTTVTVTPPVLTPMDLALTAIGAAVLVPIGEELFFRGYAMTAWLRDLGPRSALVRSTAFFAVVHVLTILTETFDEGLRQAALTVVVIAPVGALLGWLYLRRGLAASIAGHMTFNLIGVVLLALAQNAELPPPA